MIRLFISHSKSDTLAGEHIFLGAKIDDRYLFARGFVDYGDGVPMENLHSIIKLMQSIAEQLNKGIANGEGIVGETGEQEFVKLFGK